VRNVTLNSLSEKSEANAAPAVTLHHDASDVCDAVNALLKELRFDESCRAPLMAAVGYANGRTEQISAPDFLIGARMASDAEGVKRTALAKRWKRGYDRLNEAQRATGYVLVERLAGGRDTAGKNQPSRLRVFAVEYIARIVETARAKPCAHGKSDRRRAACFERAARQIVSGITPTTNAERAADRFGNRRPRRDESSMTTREVNTVKTLLCNISERAGRNHATNAERARLRALMHTLVDDAFGNDGGEAVHTLQGTERTADRGTQRANSDNLPGANVEVEHVAPAPPARVPQLASQTAQVTGGQNRDTQNVEHNAESRTPERQACAAIDAFEAAGASVFDVTLRDEERGKAADFAEMSGDELRAMMPGLIKRTEVQPLSLIVRPRGASLVQVDDLPAVAVERAKPYALLVAETSPGNHQVWFKVDVCGDELPDVRARLVRGLGGDVGASGAMRLPGTRNMKPTRGGCRVRLLQVEPGASVTLAMLEDAGLLAAPPITASPRRAPVNSATRVLPDYEKCLLSKGGDRSRADASFVKLTVMRGFSEVEAAEALQSVSVRANEGTPRNRTNYVKRTVRFAQLH
jgi:hypothetical protein